MSPLSLFWKFHPREALAEQVSPLESAGFTAWSQQGRTGGQQALGSLARVQAHITSRWPLARHRVGRERSWSRFYFSCLWLNSHQAWVNTQSQLAGCQHTALLVYKKEWPYKNSWGSNLQHARLLFETDSKVTLNHRMKYMASEMQEKWLPFPLCLNFYLLIWTFCKKQQKTYYKDCWCMKWLRNICSLKAVSLPAWYHNEAF